VIYLIGTIHVIVCIFLILVVLLQQGKGADLSVFGGGSTMTAFGARGAATLLHKLTVVSFVLFIVTTLALAVMQGRGEGGSVMSGADESAPAQPASGQPAAEPPASGSPAPGSPAAGAPAEAQPPAAAPAPAPAPAGAPPAAPAPAEAPPPQP
jgi:preprotein translocase subunit SecG